MNKLKNGAIALLLTVACGDATGVDDTNEDGVVQTQSDLTVGAKGAEVRALHDYLTQYGYLPGGTLPPGHAPLLDSPPNDENVFDEQTERALRLLQQNAGVAPTGVLDEATRTFIASPRCGNPDSKPVEGEKWAHVNRWTKRTLGWKFTPPASYPANTDLQTVNNAIAAAFAAWSDTTEIYGTPTDGRPDIAISFATSSLGSAMALSGSPDGRDSPVTIRIDPTDSWNAHVLTDVLTHEVGHTLGLGHSSIEACWDPANTFSPRCTSAKPTMAPYYHADQRYLSEDDKTAISVYYDRFLQQPGCALDIAADPYAYSVWMVSCEKSPDGQQQLMRWNGSGWDYTDGWGVSIAVGNYGRPWTLTAWGDIWTADYSNGAWVWHQVPGCGRDIGSSDGATWLLGCENIPGGHGIYRWDGGSGWINEPGGAARIDVDINGKPWLVNDAGTIFRHVSFGNWEVVPGTAKDIAIAAYGQPWIIGGDDHVYAMYEQPERREGTTVIANGLLGWDYTSSGTGRRIAAGNGVIWLVDASGRIFKQSK
jgi:peptidoglycan hydrolase-like protein with peptidoglycan-binding domain